MSHSHSDFELPGLSSRGLASWIVSISFAYSGKWNSRNLENHFHAFWNLVLLDLVDDFKPDTVVIPQFQFDILNDAPLAPNDSIVTTAQAQAKEVTPDFAIAIFHVVRCHISATLSNPSVLFPTTFDSWRDIKLRRMQIPLIAELKHPATRRAKSGELFREALEAKMRSAHADLLKQVEHAFLMQPAVEKIVLLACCGEWWSWMIAMRDAHVGEFILPSFLQPESPMELEINQTPHDIPESRTREYLPREGKKTLPGMYHIPSPSPPSDSEKFSYKPRHKGSGTPDGEREPKGEKNTKKLQFKHYTELGEGGMETVKPNV